MGVTKVTEHGAQVSTEVGYYKKQRDSISLGISFEPGIMISVNSEVTETERMTEFLEVVREELDAFLVGQREVEVTPGVPVEGARIPVDIIRSSSVRIRNDIGPALGAREYLWILYGQAVFASEMILGRHWARENTCGYYTVKQCSHPK